MPHQICLEWNNHKTLLNELKNFLIMETMVDVTLACDGRILKAHKLILSACSPFFQAMLRDNPCKHPVVILANVKYEYLEAVIHFMYHGEVNVNEDQLEGLFETASILKVKVLGEVVNLNNESAENQFTDGSGKQFVDDSDNVSSDATVYQLESTTPMPSPKNKLNFSLNSMEKKSVEESVASTSEVVFEDTTFNTVEEILTTNEQQTAEETVDIVSEKDPESIEEIHPKETSSNNLSGPSSSQPDVSQHQSSSGDSGGTASSIPSLPPSFVVLRDVMSAIPENVKVNSSPDVPKKKPQSKTKLKKISKKSTLQSNKLQKSRTKDSGDAVSRKVLNKIDNTGSTNGLVKSFKCKLCDYRSAYSQTLKRHFLVRHEKIRNFKCDRCSYAAKLKQHLDRHIADIHEKGELRYRCTLCPYKSSHSGNLKKHFENIHEKKKLFKCDRCEFESYHKVCIMKHIVGIHERRRDFLCDFCTYRCSAIDNLRRHVFLRHGLKLSKLNKV